MNWYKKANLYDEISNHGPKGSGYFPRHETFNYGEGEYENLVQYAQNKFNSSREEAEEYVRGNIRGIRRDYFVSNYGWSVPTEDITTKLAQFIGNDTVLEVGSGYGLWSKLLNDMGVNTIATTRRSDNEQDATHMPQKDRSFTDVENIKNLDAVEKYPQANVLMMSWPPYNDAMAYQTLKNFKGNKIIYIGEGSGGCTGCDRFHNLLNKEWKEVYDFDVEDLPQWAGLHDAVYLYVRG
jgi:hypothetical protein